MYKAKKRGRSIENGHAEEGNIHAHKKRRPKAISFLFIVAARDFQQVIAISGLG